MLPTSWRRIPITGRFVGRDGVPIVGRLLFDSAQVVEIDGTLIVPRRIAIALNTDGDIPTNTSLPSTNDPDLSITGWAYTVTEDWVGGRKPYRMFVPYDAVSISIPEVAHAVPPPELIENRGPQGYSAYQLAQAAGFEGNEEQWLSSLVGPAGVSSSTVMLPFSFSYGDASPAVVFVPPSQMQVFSVSLKVTQEFNGTNPEVRLGTSGQPGLLMDAWQMDLGTVSVYQTDPRELIQSNQAIVLTMNPGSGATEGSGQFVITLFPSA